MIPGLKGWNTVIGFFLVGALGVAWNMGWIDEKTAAWVATVLVPYTGISLRSAVKKP